MSYDEDDEGPGPEPGPSRRDQRSTNDHRAHDDSGPSRRPPYNEEAERSLLGAAILSRKALEAMVLEVRPEDFYIVKHRRVAEALFSCYAAGLDENPTDPVSLAHVLEKSGDLDGIGGPGYLIELQGATPATSSAPRYASIVHGHATLRRTIEATGKIAELAYGLADPHELASRTAELLGNVHAQNGARTYSALEVADVEALIAGGLTADEPDFLTRVDGKALLYAGKMHSLQAEPESGKTWIALAAALEVLELGGAVVFLDYEDVAKTILGRLLALGADPDAVRARFRYVQVAGAFGTTEKAELFALLANLNPDLVVLDGVAEALARDGFSEDSAVDFVQWTEKLPRPIARTGAAVLLLDHVAKDKESQGRWARGTGAKLGVIDGAAYTMKVATTFSRRRPGLVRLTIAKDKPGGVGARGECAAVAHFEPHADGVRVVVRLEAEATDRSIADVWKPSILMRRVSEELERSGAPMMARTLKSLVHSEKPKLLEEAIGRLEQEGYIARTRLGRATAYEHVRSYLEPDPPSSKAKTAHEPPVDDAPPELFDDAHPAEVVDLEQWKTDNF